jgi:hypothetical protein
MLLERAKQNLSFIMPENELEVEELSELPEITEGEEDLTDWKALALRNHGIAKRLKTKLAKASEAKPEPKVEPEPEDKKIDYAEKAYLKASGIEPDEMDFVYEVMASTGKSLDEVLEAKYFQAELKERRETKAVKEAIPTGGKRSGTAARDTVEYHLSKGTPIMEIEDVKLRREVLNTRLKSEENKQKFSPEPVIK